MAYNLWFSKKHADSNAGTQTKEDWMGNPAWTDQGYAIAADKDGTLIQFMDGNDRVSSALQTEDRHAYIIASALHRDDFPVLVNRKGEINEKLAEELDLQADITVIKSLVANFHEPQQATQPQQTVKTGQKGVSVTPLARR